MRFAFVVVLLAGCDFYFSDGDDEPPCPTFLSPDPGLRNPQNGECQSFGTPPCDDRCGPCPQTDRAMPDWGACEGRCSGFNADQCKAQPGCFAAFTEFPTQDRAAEFRGCWDTAPSGPIGGSCTGLDAQQCSRHDNCTAHYIDNPASDPSGQFSFCKDEVATAACSTLATEAQCSARSDCVSIYKGEDCTCTPSDCDCKVLTYQRCEAR